MFKNSKTSIIIFAVLVVAAIAFFPTIGSNVKEYKDTNGENDFSLCKITDEDIVNERASIAREHGLPIEMTIVRLIDIPADVAKKLSKPKSCDDAIKMAENLGGAPQKLTAMQYELAQDIRERIVELPKLTWSTRQDGNVLLVCDTKKTKEYGDLDNIIKQNDRHIILIYFKVKKYINDKIF